MNAEWLTCLLLTLIILALWAVCRRVQGSWVGPGGILCAVWFFGSLLPLFCASFFPIKPIAYLLVLAFVVCGVFGSSLAMLAGTPLQPTLPSNLRNPRPDTLPSTADRLRHASPLLERSYIALLIAGSMTPALLYMLAVQQFGTNNLMELAIRVTVARYAGEFEQPLTVSILTMFLFCAALLGGFLFNTQGQRRTGTQNSGKRTDPIHPSSFILHPSRKGRYLLWLIPLLLCALIQTTKASVLFGGALFAAGYVGGLTLRGKADGVSLSRLMTSILGLCALAFAFVFVALLVRYGISDTAAAADHIPQATVYFTGHMSALGTWIRDGGNSRIACSGGSFTFGGLFALFGLHDRTQGLYDDMIVFSNGEMTNIYTAFRSCIEDFTLPGALIFFTVLSFFGGLGWVAARRGQIAGGTLFIAYLAYLFLSPITSVFVYNTNVGALGLFGLLMLITRPAPRPLPIRKEARLELI